MHCPYLAEFQCLHAQLTIPRAAEWLLSKKPGQEGKMYAILPTAYNFSAGDAIPLHIVGRGLWIDPFTPVGR